MKLVYADYNSTAPCSASHIDQVASLLKQVDGNPSNIHPLGRKAKRAVEEARTAIASLLGGQREEVIFTSGATESNNWIVNAILKAEASKGRFQKPHIIISAVEHSSLRKTVLAAAEAGACELTMVGVDRRGRVKEQELLAAVNEHTVLASLIYANNEVGAINDISNLAGKLKALKPDLHFHVDAVQAFGKLDLTWLGGASQVDSAAISAHKVGGFKGVGGLWLRKELTSSLSPLLYGGGQERFLRSGTENVPGIISFGLRAQDILAHPQWLAHVQELSQNLRQGLAEIPGAEVHGDPEGGLPTTVNFHIADLSGEVLLLQFEMAGICVSTGSACSSGVPTPSPVLLAMGYPEWVALNSIRVSFGGGSSAEDVQQILRVIKQCRFA